MVRSAISSAQQEALLESERSVLSQGTKSGETRLYPSRDDVMNIEETRFDEEA